MSASRMASARLRRAELASTLGAWFAFVYRGCWLSLLGLAGYVLATAL